MTECAILKQEVLKGKKINKSEAMELYEQPLEELCACADEIRRSFLSGQFDICCIINGEKRAVLGKLPLLRSIQPIFNRP